jgi:hypothetical protein
MSAHALLQSLSCRFIYPRAGDRCPNHKNGHEARHHQEQRVGCGGKHAPMTHGAGGYCAASVICRPRAGLLLAGSTYRASAAPHIAPATVMRPTNCRSGTLLCFWFAILVRAGFSYPMDTMRTLAPAAQPSKCSGRGRCCARMHRTMLLASNEVQVHQGGNATRSLHCCQSAL